CYLEVFLRRRSGPGVNRSANIRALHGMAVLGARRGAASASRPTAEDFDEGAVQRIATLAIRPGRPRRGSSARLQGRLEGVLMSSGSLVTAQRTTGSATIGECTQTSVARRTPRCDASTQCARRCKLGARLLLPVAVAACGASATRCR